MRRALLIVLTTILTAGIVASQVQQRPVQQRPATQFEVSEYGVDFQSDPRLIVVMAALDAAGWDPVPAGQPPSAFRAKLRKDLVNLDPDLRRRLKDF